MSSSAKVALLWITTILTNHAVPFQISGGLAVRAYGGMRALADIDIDIAEKDFSLILEEVKPYIIFGPAHYKSDKWDLYLMTLNYQGQEIDISGAFTVKIFNSHSQTWEPIISNLANATHQTVLDLVLPIIPRDELIAYKTILGRDVDLLDIAELS